MTKQVGGDHYQLPIEPIVFIVNNKIGFLEGNAIKYLCRFRHKGNPLEDLEKAKHYIEMLIMSVKDEQADRIFTNRPADDASRWPTLHPRGTAIRDDRCCLVPGATAHVTGCVCTDRTANRGAATEAGFRCAECGTQMIGLPRACPTHGEGTIPRPRSRTVGEAPPQ